MEHHDTPSTEATPPTGAEQQQQPAVTPPEEPSEKAIFQSDAEFNHVDDSWPACLRTPKSGFWDNVTFI
ncbi:MAG: hypothetical protein HDT09_01495 [Bacteroidales bacterium]|nr:hypothetical protein [Bacteroidales bacterium]